MSILRIMKMEVLLSAAMGLIFLAGAVPKLRHPRGFVLAVLEYRVLPLGLSRFYARLIPPLELLLALLLLTGTAVRAAAIVLSVLLLSFIVAIGINLVRGRDLDCHCFGRTSKRLIGWRVLLQDTALLSAAIIVLTFTREWVAPESWSLFRLLGLVPAGSPGPLLGCMVTTMCTAVLLAGRHLIGGGG